MFSCKKYYKFGQKLISKFTCPLSPGYGHNLFGSILLYESKINQYTTHYGLLRELRIQKRFLSLYFVEEMFCPCFFLAAKCRFKNSSFIPVVVKDQNGRCSLLIVDLVTQLSGVCNGTNSTCIGCDGVLNSGKVNDTCGVCEGNGTSCTTIVKSIPRTIANCNATVWVVGAGLDAGVKIVCGLYDPVNGGLPVFNTTGK